MASSFPRFRGLPLENVTEERLEVVRFSGRLKWFDRQRGFGFVVIDNSEEEILLHSNIVRDFGRGSIAEGSNLLLGAIRTSRGIRAVAIYELINSAEQVRLPVRQRDRNCGRTDFVAARVKWFNEQKGYGFVNVFGKACDYFLHVRVVRAAGMDVVEKGEAISVRLEKNDRGVFVGEIGTWSGI